MWRYKLVFPFLEDLIEADAVLVRAVEEVGTESRDCVFITRLEKESAYELATESGATFQLIERKLAKQFGQRMRVENKNNLKQVKLNCVDMMRDAEVLISQ